VGITATFFVGSSSGSVEGALAREVYEAEGCWVSDAEVEEEDLGTEDNAQVGAAIIDPVILAWFNETLPANAVDPVC
jgi:hypothetical protein